MPKGSRAISAKDKFAGFTWLSRYCQLHSRPTAPMAETLEVEISKLNRYIAAKQHELDDVVTVKDKMKAGLLVGGGADDGPAQMGPTLRMVFRRAEAQLMRDIKELGMEREMVHNALLELPGYNQKEKEKKEKFDAEIEDVAGLR